MHSQLEDEIKEYFNMSCGILMHMVWDTMKAVMRGKITALTSSSKKEQRKCREDLLQWIETLEKQHTQKKHGSNQVYKALFTERKTLEVLEMNKIQQNILYLQQKYCFCTPRILKITSLVSVQETISFPDPSHKRRHRSCMLTADIL